eukprot:TRINITY_DN4209_c0_g1_i1.p1 TRINITY_DN4209_c0_g1~~TRINITY_DN4209_c0_g1_i1.p1  ORF type:complete len:209 (-),score=18.93 TRINITY_DN4209_c0_g1_i1:41-640(-)
MAWSDVTEGFKIIFASTFLGFFFMIMFMEWLIDQTLDNDITLFFGSVGATIGLIGSGYFQISKLLSYLKSDSKKYSKTNHNYDDKSIAGLKEILNIVSSSGNWNVSAPEPKEIIRRFSYTIIKTYSHKKYFAVQECKGLVSTNYRVVAAEPSGENVIIPLMKNTNLNTALSILGQLSDLEYGGYDEQLTWTQICKLSDQ